MRISGEADCGCSGLALGRHWVGGRVGRVRRAWEGRTHQTRGSEGAVDVEQDDGVLDLALGERREGGHGCGGWVFANENSSLCLEVERQSWGRIGWAEIAWPDYCCPKFR